MDYSPQTPLWPPAAPPSDDPEPDHFGCMAAIVSWFLTLLLLGILCAFTSCRSPRTVVVEDRDSTSVQVHHNVVYVPDTVPVTLPPQTVERITPDTTSTLRTDYAESTATVTGGMLHHTLRTLQTPVPVVVNHRETTHDSIVYRYRKVPVPVPVEVEVEKSLTSWQTFRLYLANITLIGAALFAVLWFLKRKFLGS